MAQRRIAFLTGTRADYALLYPVMKVVERHSKLKLFVIATGMHLMPDFGYTVEEIEKDGFLIHAKVPMYLSGDTGATIARSLGIGIIGITQAIEQIAPDILVVLGDRSEILAAVVVAVHMNVPVAHIHGGDSTTGGCIDEQIRHAITRFAHIHFPATPKSAERLIKMGEEPWRIHIVGPLGIYATPQTDFIPKEKLARQLNFDSNKPIFLVLQHPVTTQSEKAGSQMRETMEALAELKQQAVIIYPNTDAGGHAMIDLIKEYESKYSIFKVYKSLSCLTFVSLMKCADVMIGNSSSAIVEAPLFGIPVVNIGIRQEGRERGYNVIDVPPEKEKIVKAIQRALTDKEFRKKIREYVNPFDIEKSGGEKIAEILSSVDINNRLLQKSLTY